MKTQKQIFIVFVFIALASCTGSKKYFKAAEKLEKQGLVNDAAEYYLESLQRKPTNVEARIKLKDVGQKCVSNMASEFFRNYNTQQLEASLESFERLKSFTGRTSALNVVLDYPKSYEEDYQKAVDTYCNKNFNQAYANVNQKKYNDAVVYINNIKKYNPSFKTTQQLEVVAVCEPLYQNAVTCLENKNYSGAFNLLNTVKSKTDNYKDSKDLYELAAAGQTKNFILFAPKNNGAEKGEKDLEDFLFNNFNQVATQKFNFAKVINNTPFTTIADLDGSGNVDLIQAIRKATGADYFYTFDVSNRKEFNSGPMKTGGRAFQEVKTRKNDTVVITEYRPVDYNLVKANRSYSYQYNYKLYNAYSNQIVSSQSQIISAQDAVEYNEFARPYNGNINSLFPYNPQVTPPMAQFNPNNFRKAFSSNSTLKTFDQLKEETNNKTINIFSSSVLNNIK